MFTVCYVVRYPVNIVVKVMSKSNQNHSMSPDEYLAGEKTAIIRHEYISGDIYAMAVADEQHNRITGNVFFQPRAKARGGRCGVYMSGMKLRVDNGICFYFPDMMLSCEVSDTQLHFKDNSCLIAEVTSPSTESTDRREKLLAYKK